MGRERLFVYGTLRPAALARAPEDIAAAIRARAQAIGAGCIEGALHWVSWYPALVEDRRRRVMGDVYALEPDLLAELDAYEADEYGRRRVRVALDEGGEIEAWTYLFLDDARLGPRIGSGDFLKEAAIA